MFPEAGRQRSRSRRPGGRCSVFFSATTPSASATPSRLVSRYGDRRARLALRHVDRAVLGHGDHARVREFGELRDAEAGRELERADTPVGRLELGRFVDVPPNLHLSRLPVLRRPSGRGGE